MANGDTKEASGQQRTRDSINKEDTRDAGTVGGQTDKTKQDKLKCGVGSVWLTTPRYRYAESIRRSMAPRSLKSV